MIRHLDMPEMLTSIVCKTFFLCLEISLKSLSTFFLFSFIHYSSLVQYNVLLFRKISHHVTVKRDMPHPNSLHNQVNMKMNVNMHMETVRLMTQCSKVKGLLLFRNREEDCYRVKKSLCNKTLITKFKNYL